MWFFKNIKTIEKKVNESEQKQAVANRAVYVPTKTKEKCIYCGLPVALSGMCFDCLDMDFH